MSCPLCTPNDQGFQISVPSSSEHQDISTMLGQNNAHFHPVDDVTFFIDGPQFYRFYDYWTQFYDTDRWVVQPSTRNGLSQPKLRDAIGWKDLADLQPAVWIRELVERDGIRMMVQPIVHLDAPHRVAGYEMLARGIEPDGSMIPPNVLFSQARDQEQLFLLDKTCRIRGIETAGLLPGHPVLFINFIPTSIYVPEHCLQSTLNAIERCGIAPSQIVFEVVETEQVKDVRHLKRILDFYKQSGLRYALDDVGAGFNNVTMLEDLKPDFVKLDRAYVDGIDHDAAKQAVAKEVLDVALRIGATPLAEGIERREEVDFLGQMGYRWQQGYYYGKPTFPEALAAAQVQA